MCDGIEKDKRAKQIEDSEIRRVKKDFDDQFRILEAAIYARLRMQIMGRIMNGGPGNAKKGAEITNDYLDALKKDEWFQIRMKDEDAAEFVEKAQDQVARHRAEFDKRTRRGAEWDTFGFGGVSFAMVLNQFSKTVALHPDLELLVKGVIAAPADDQVARANFDAMVARLERWRSGGCQDFCVRALP